MAVGILCPSKFEYKSLDTARLKRSGAVIEVSGMGKLRAMLGCVKLHKRHPKLKAILLIGFAGSLTPDLAIGDIVEPDLFIEHDYRAEPFEPYPNRIAQRRAKRLITGSKRSVMLTQDQFLTKNPYAGTRSPFGKPITCDMESFAVAKFCAETRLQFKAVKLISDVADENADHDFLASCRKLAPKLNHTIHEAFNSLNRVLKG